MRQRLLSVLFLAVSSVWAIAASPFEIHAVADAAGEGIREYSTRQRDGGTEKLLLHPEVLLDRAAVQSVEALNGLGGTMEIQITLTEAGAKRFGVVSEKYLNKRLGILLDGQLHSAPMVRTPIPGGKITVTGSFTPAEAVEFVKKFNAGAAQQAR